MGRCSNQPIRLHASLHLYAEGSVAYDRTPARIRSCPAEEGILAVKQKRRGYAIGVDYGTNSVRCLIVDLDDGCEFAVGVFDYPSGSEGVLLDASDPNLARQNPADYMEGFFHSVSVAVNAAKRKRGFSTNLVAGIGVDATGSTPIPVDRAGRPLALHAEFKKNLAAQAWLWKDHTAHAEAAEITRLAARSRDKYLDVCGGAYSSEWYWSKILHCKRTAPRVFDAAYSWVELADFIPAWISGRTNPDDLSRGACAAGHKAMFGEAWGGLPRESFLAKLDPGLINVRRHHASGVETSDRKAGELSAEIASKVGLPAGIPVAVGAIDAHMGAIGAGVRPGTLVKIIGTSTCDMTVMPKLDSRPNIPGLCGIAEGSILPGMYGLEAGQSAVGDIFNWFVKNLAPSAYARDGGAHAALTRAASKLAPGESGLLALDWNNGNRNVLADPSLTGLLVGQTLHTTAPEVYRALVEATAFGALKIIHRLEEYAVPIKEIVACGGVAEKNPLLMQIYADACNRPIKISRTTQTCALGAAICGAVAGRAFRNVRAAQRLLTGVKELTYRPTKPAAKTYSALYALYNDVHDAFGATGSKKSLAHVMKELITIREQARQS